MGGRSFGLALQPLSTSVWRDGESFARRCGLMIRHGLHPLWVEGIMSGLFWSNQILRFRSVGDMAPQGRSRHIICHNTIEKEYVSQDSL